MLFLAIRARHHFPLTLLENILTFHVLLRKELPRQPVCTENPIRVDGALESPKLAE
jgi:hypothetical protein